MRHAMADRPPAIREEMNMRQLPVIALLLLTIAPCQADPAPLGRLFLDPQQRAKLDLQRQRNPGLQHEPVDSDASLTINGEVRSSTGRRTRWINGEADWNNASSAPRIPVGNTYYPETGQNDNLLGNGRIQVKPHRLTP